MKSQCELNRVQFHEQIIEDDFVNLYDMEPLREWWWEKN